MQTLVITSTPLPLHNHPSTTYNLQPHNHPPTTPTHFLHPPGNSCSMRKSSSQKYFHLWSCETLTSSPSKLKLSRPILSKPKWVPIGIWLARDPMCWVTLLLQPSGQCTQWGRLKAPRQAISAIKSNKKPTQEVNTRHIAALDVDLVGDVLVFLEFYRFNVYSIFNIQNELYIIVSVYLLPG